MRKTLFILTKLLMLPTLAAQNIVPVAFGDMESWQRREVKESFIIGGETKTLYEIGTGETLRNNTPFVNTSSDWATSSVMAHVGGIYKGSVTVFPDTRDCGETVARLETKLEHVKVLGIINISALATGSIFLGQVIEPIRNTKNPLAKLVQGITYTDRPAFVQFDYKFVNGNNGDRIMESGFTKRDVAGKNAAEVSLILQHRWEDGDGNVHAKRVGTGWKRYPENSAGWVDNEHVAVLYGDITKHDDFEPYMGLIQENRLHTRNSMGEMVPINEASWATEDEKPTHIILRFSSSFGGAYVGAPGSKLWVDNVALGYDD